jgi:hypothetical protein
MPLRVVDGPGLTMVRDQPRAALAAVVDGDHGPFTVLAVHLSFVPGWNVAQLMTLRRWIADLPRPHLLLGDFNMIGPTPRIVLNARTPRAGWQSLARSPTYPAHHPRVQFDHLLATGVSGSRDHRGRHPSNANLRPTPGRRGNAVRKRTAREVSRMRRTRGSREMRLPQDEACLRFADTRGWHFGLFIPCFADRPFASSGSPRRSRAQWACAGWMACMACNPRHSGYDLRDDFHVAGSQVGQHVY